MEICAQHPRKGDCVIREILPGTGRLRGLVDYPLLGILRLPEFLDELVERGTGKPLSLNFDRPSNVEGVSRRDVTLPWRSARQTLLALRLGQSTPDSVRDLSVGMEDVNVECQHALDRAAAGEMSFLLIASPYGMGKSHALAHLRQLAHAVHMATGSVVLDGVGVSLCAPMTVLAALARNIEFPDDNPDGLSQRLAALVRTKDTERLKLSGCPLLYDVLRRVDAAQVEDPNMWEVIEDFLSLEVGAGEVRSRAGLVVPALKVVRHDRPRRCAELIWEWARACCVTNARNGLVIMCDEADVDYAQSGRSKNEREQRYELFRAWREIAMEQRALGCGGLVVAIAITPGTTDSDPIDGLRTELGPCLNTIRLREPTISELRDLGKRLCKLYGEAYGLGEDRLSASSALVEQCIADLARSSNERNPRRFIRHLLEKLDTTYA